MGFDWVALVWVPSPQPAAPGGPKCPGFGFRICLWRTSLAQGLLATMVSQFKAALVRSPGWQLASKPVSKAGDLAGLVSTSGFKV